MLSYDFFKDFLENSPVLDNKYKILQTIGEGRYAKVKLAINLEDKKKYAIKIMKEDQVNTAAKLEAFMNEVQILSSVQHRHIVKMVYVSLKGECKKPNGKVSKVVYYVMKFAEYGELFEILQKTTGFSERLARYYFRQLLEGIEHLHNSCIGHRDIKTENILIDHKFNLKLADFGCACKSREHNLQRIGFNNQAPVGSPEYNAPEIANNSVSGEYYAEEADIFASGASLFVMVLQSVPFNSSSFSDPYYSRLCKKDTSRFWKIFDSENTLSFEFKDLMEKMMESTPQKRINIDSIKKHPWFLGPTPSYEEVVSEMKKRGEIILIQNQEKLRNYHTQKARKMQNSSTSGPTMSGFRNSFEVELEKLRQMMESTIVEVNLKLMKDPKDKSHKMAHDKSAKSSPDSNKNKGRRRSSEMELAKDKEKSANYNLGMQKDINDKPKMFIDEAYSSHAKDSPPQRPSPTFRNGNNQRIRRSGSDE